MATPLITGTSTPDPEEWPLASPAPRGGILEVFRRRYLLKLVVKRQLAQQYSASFLGFMWSYVQPLIRFLVYYFAVGMVLKAHVDTPYSDADSLLTSASGSTARICSRGSFSYGHEHLLRA